MNEMQLAARYAGLLCQICKTEGIRAVLQHVARANGASLDYVADSLLDSPRLNKMEERLLDMVHESAARSDVAGLAPYRTMIRHLLPSEIQTKLDAYYQRVAERNERRQRVILGAE